MEDDNAELWEAHASWWQEHFTLGADPEYEDQILPLAVQLTAGARRVLEVGTGEGQVARAVASAHHAAVTGIDPTAAQIDEAVRRGGGPCFVRSGAASLPFAGSTFDTVVACLVFEHIDTMDEAVREVARVLEPGGRFHLFLNHPILQTPGSAWIDDHMVDPPEQYWRLGPYLTETANVEEVEKGVFIRFVHRPLSRYVNALAANGLTIEGMLEPAPPASFLARAGEYDAAAAYPRLLVLSSLRA